MDLRTILFLTLGLELLIIVYGVMTDLSATIRTVDYQIPGSYRPRTAMEYFKANNLLFPIDHIWITPFIPDKGPATLVIMEPGKQIIALWYSPEHNSVSAWKNAKFIPEIWDYLIRHDVDSDYVIFLKQKYGKLEDVEAALDPRTTWEIESIR